MTAEKIRNYTTEKTLNQHNLLTAALPTCEITASYRLLVLYANHT